jgi:putative DNA primase/helicase
MMDARTLALSLPGARRAGAGWVACCPAHADQHPSLSIRDGAEGPLLKCHAGCDNRDVIAALAGRDLWAQSTDRGHHAPVSEPTWPGPADGDATAMRWWREAQPADGTPAETWLRTRGWTGPIPPSLRFHPECPCGRDRRLPAMIAAVQASDRRVVATHRTFLAPDGRGKADLDEARLWKGEFGDAAVRLAAADTDLGICEGIEDALAVMEMGGPPCWAAGNATRLPNVALPACVRHVHLFRDRDAAGEKHADLAASRYSAEGRRVTIHAPPRPHNDFNDVLMAQGVPA